MDTQVTVAGVGGLALLGGAFLGYLGTRKSRAGTVLDEAQAADVVTQAAERVVEMMADERRRMAERLVILENEVSDLRIKVARLEAREQELLAQRDQLLSELSAAHAELEHTKGLLAVREQELLVVQAEMDTLRTMIVTQPGASTGM